jgi:hypothetical protein
VGGAKRIVAACVVALGLGVPAGAGAALSGVSGTVVDAETGLGVAGVTLAWPSTGGSAVSAGDGRYLLAGLPPGTTGALAVSGPSGYAPQTLAGIALPANTLASQDVALRRDWAAGVAGTAGAAGAPGCEVEKATDNDDTTGFVAAPGTTVTLTLPQPIEVHQLQVVGAPVCGATALDSYTIATSGDGNAYTNAVANQDVDIPSVRFVRLTMQGTAPSLGLGELRVLGAGPDLPPAGTLTTDAPKSYINQTVRLRAAFTDPDSRIVRYLWDFDGDGRFDQATSGPSVAHVWLGAGIHHVTVGVRDFQGALGTSAIDLRIIDPAVPAQPIIQRKPLITFDPVDGIDLPVRIACSSTCTFRATLTLSKATAKAIHAPRRTILTLTKRTEGPGLGSWTIELPSKTIRLLRRAHRATLKAHLTATATDQQNRRSATHRWVSFR